MVCGAEGLADVFYEMDFTRLTYSFGLMIGARWGSNVCSSARAELEKSCLELRMVCRALKPKTVKPVAMEASLIAADMFVVFWWC
jgi:hypothetical protein